MAFKDGDVIEFDYELWVEGRDGLFDTTLGDAAKEAGIAEMNAYYAPMTIVLGAGRIIPGLDRALKAAALGETRVVELPPVEGYGERDLKLVETIPMSEFKKNDLTPQPGLQLNYRNRRGTVTTVGGGRVRIDFNHALAGKRLKSRFTVRKAAATDAERVAGLLRMNFPAPVEWDVKTEKVGGKPAASVTVPEPVVLNQNWLPAKFRALMDMRRHTELDQVRFVESYRLRPEEPTAETPRPAPAT